MMISNASFVAKDFYGMAITIPAAAKRIMRAQAFALRNRIQANASGRPGPEVETGDYRRSWGVERIAESVSNVTYEVGTDAEQAMRLELGFHGTDSLGRRYNQPPFPHVQVAADQIDMTTPGLVEAVIPR